MAFLRRSTPVPPDDHSERVPPDPMPNSAVKPLSADGSVGPPHARVGHCQALIPKIPSTKVLGIFLWAWGVPLFTWWGRFAGRPLAGSGRSTALVAVPRRARRSHPHARVADGRPAEGRPEHRQACLPNPGLLVGVLSLGGLPGRAAEGRPADGISHGNPPLAQASGGFFMGVCQ